MTADTNPDFRATIAGYDPNAPAPARIAPERKPVQRTLHPAKRKYPEPRLGEVIGCFTIVAVALGNTYYELRVLCECGVGFDVNENDFRKRVARGAVCRHRRDGR